MSQFCKPKFKTITEMRYLIYIFCLPFSYSFFTWLRAALLCD